MREYTSAIWHCREKKSFFRTGLIIDAYRRSSKAILERCCSHSCHLINRILPMFLVLRVVFPCFHLQHWLQIFSLEYFGCTCLVHIHDKQRRKLDPRALKCMFIGYSTNKKGYKAIILWLENYLWPWMLLFMKQRHLFKPQTSGRSLKDEEIVLQSANQALPAESLNPTAESHKMQTELQTRKCYQKPRSLRKLSFNTNA